VSANHAACLAELHSSITLVGEGDRKMLKAAIKHSVGEDNVRHRVIPADVLARWAKKVEEVKADIVVILQEEKEEKQVLDRGLF
jgi:ATP-dependent RNA helicase DDX27